MARAGIGFGLGGIACSGELVGLEELESLVLMVSWCFARHFSQIYPSLLSESCKTCCAFPHIAKLISNSLKAKGPNDATAPMRLLLTVLPSRPLLSSVMSLERHNQMLPGKFMSSSLTVSQTHPNQESISGWDNVPLLLPTSLPLTYDHPDPFLTH